MSITCPYCYKGIGPHGLWADEKQDKGSYAPILYRVLCFCPLCKEVFIVHIRVRTPQQRSSHQMGVINNLIVDIRDESNIESIKIITSSLPPPLSAEEKEDPIKRLLHEAEVCFSVDAYNGSAAVLRSCWEALCKREGCSEKKLYKKIDELHAKGRITEYQRRSVHGIRMLGNEGAHGLSDVDREEAKIALDVTKNIMQAMDGDDSIKKMMEQRTTQEADDKQKKKENESQGGEA